MLQKPYLAEVAGELRLEKVNEFMSLVTPVSDVVAASRAVQNLGDRARRARVHASLTGDINTRAYERMLRMQLRRLRRLIEATEEEIFEQFHHSHTWNGSDYCNVCGLDGRA